MIEDLSKSPSGNKLIVIIVSFLMGGVIAGMPTGICAWMTKELFVDFFSEKEVISMAIGITIVAALIGAVIGALIEKNLPGKLDFIEIGRQKSSKSSPLNKAYFT
ncbi:MAG: hypothetical protein HRK26_00535 [Rickettsiaceae bacterium H1]|nr:hypothetical protein [Rickettsiaceae bacterium H1]